MKLIPLTPDSPDVMLAQQLNEEAFPDNERVDLDDFFRSNTDGQLEILAIYADEAFSGFFVMRLFQNIAYMAFFAVIKEKRSLGIGSQVLKDLKEYYPGKQIVVDFESVREEAANKEQRQRRRNFYLRNGFYETGWFQFYSDTEFEIVCSVPMFDKETFEALIADIHARVPEFDPHLYNYSLN